MLTRRECCLGGLAAIPFVGAAAPVRSIIGARSIENIDSSALTTNPYITDGLIAMWDGEWNIGLGKHDPNATTWVDVIGGLTYNLAAAAKIESKSIFSQGMITRMASDVIVPLCGTIEICFERPSGGLPHSVYDLNRSQYLYIASGNKIWTSGKASSSEGDDVSIGLWSNLYHTYSFIYDFAKGYPRIKQMYADGLDKTVKGSKDYWGGSINYGINFGYNGREDFRIRPCRVYCLRCYRQELMESDIIRNYSIDAERFGV